MKVMKLAKEFFIQTRDVDMNKFIKPAAIFDYFQDLAAVHAAELGFGYKKMLEKRYAWVLLYQEFEIMNLPLYADTIVVSTWPKPKRRLEFEREFLISNSAGKQLIKGISNWVIINFDTRNLIRSDEIDFTGIYYDHTNYEEKCKRRLNLDKSLITDWFEYQISYDDLDQNGHTNNAKYLTMVLNHCNLYGKKNYIKKAKVAYIKETRYEDTISFGHFSLDKEEAFIGYLHNEICFECLLEVE